MMVLLSCMFCFVCTGGIPGLCKSTHLWFDLHGNVLMIMTFFQWLISMAGTSLMSDTIGIELLSPATLRVYVLSASGVRAIHLCVGSVEIFCPSPAS